MFVGLNLKTEKEMKYNELSISEVSETLESICEDYGYFLNEESWEEVFDKFCDYYVNVSFVGMTKSETDQFVNVLESIFNQQLQLTTQE
jgi:UDP-N-acetyl-D-mannosaminuronic acid transferase (WecB/TagA/CpsF family)